MLIARLSIHVYPYKTLAYKKVTRPTPLIPRLCFYLICIIFCKKIMQIK